MHFERQSMTQQDLKQPLSEYLQENLPFYLDMLKQMVAINSFTANPKGVNSVGELTAEFFTELGFTPRYIPAVNPLFGRHVVLTRPGRKPHKIGLVSHLDTVFTKEEEVRNNFFWQEVGDKIYGPGTNDIKGGTVMIYMVLAALRKFVPELYNDVTWVILLNAAEEELVEDFGRICQRVLSEHGLACLVFESGEQNERGYSIVTSRKGRADYRIVIEGRGAHAGSNHKDGANALVQLAHTIQKVAALTDYERELTYNVGVATGGTVVNRVPHQATAMVEMRTFSPEVFRDGVAKMLALNGQSDVTSAEGDFTTGVSIKLRNETAPWGPNEESDSLLKIWQEAAKNLEQKVFPEARGGLSDGNWVWRTVPTIDGLGPIGGCSHCSQQAPEINKEQEYVLRSSFVPKAMLNVQAIIKLAETLLKKGD